MANAVKIAFAAGVAALFLCLPVGATAAPTPFLLTFDGAHVPDAGMPEGLRHEGRFTASAPLCSAGRAYDVHQVVEGEFLSVHRIHTCDDGTGSFTAWMPIVRNEHGGASGAWRIVEGTGQYAKLRGFGTYTSTLIVGDPLVFMTISYRTTWQGVVAFDADPPAIESFTATARALRRPLRTYAVQVALAAQDATAPVSYAVDVRVGRTPLDFKQASTASGQATVTLRLRAPRGVRSARVSVVARDAVGNETTATRTVRLR